MIFFRTGNVNTFPATSMQIRLRSAVFSAIVPYIAWETDAGEVLHIRQKGSKIVPVACAHTAGRIMLPFVKK